MVSSNWSVPAPVGRNGGKCKTTALLSREPIAMPVAVISSLVFHATKALISPYSMGWTRPNTI